MILPDDLIANSVAERTDLEFKRELPGGSQRDKAELLKDVSAMANAGGGMIYYGISEAADGVAGKICPINHSQIDVEKRRISQILESGIEPRLAGVEFREFVCDGGLVLAIEVPPTFSGPCRRVHDGHSKFFIRNHSHINEMSYDQLRRYFQRSAESISFARLLWDKALTRLKLGQTWRPMVNGPVCLAQMVPLSAAISSLKIDVKSLRNRHDLFMKQDWSGCSGRFNLDGVVHYPGLNDGKVPCFVQIYRNGVVESYRTGGSIWDEKKIIPSQTVAEFYRGCYQDFSKFIKDQKLSGPFIFNFALTGIKGFRLALGSSYFDVEELISEREDLIFPELYFESSPDASDESHIRDILDIMWQSFGAESCNYYNAEGVWVAR